MLAGKLLIQSTLTGEIPKFSQGNSISVFGQRVGYSDLNGNFTFNCQNLSTLLGGYSCNNLKFTFFSKTGQLFNITSNSTTMLNLTKFGRNAAVDVTGVISFLNTGKQYSPYLTISLSNLSSTSSFNTNGSDPFIDIQLPAITQRADKGLISNNNISCSFLNETNENWLGDGCSILTQNTNNTDLVSVTCRCNHLTLFALDVTAAKSAFSSSNAGILNNGTNKNNSE